MLDETEITLKQMHNTSMRKDHLWRLRFGEREKREKEGGRGFPLLSCNLDRVVSPRSTVFVLF